MRGWISVSLGLAVALALTAPDPARGAQVSRSGALLVYTADPSERNDLTITQGAAGIDVTDKGNHVEPGAMCSEAPDFDEPRDGAEAREPPAVRCQGENLAAVRVLLRDRADVASVTVAPDVNAYVAGGAGDDRITGAVAPNIAGLGLGLLDDDRGMHIVGGRGADTIDVLAPGTTATVLCGAGFDIVELDQADRPSDGCEGRALPGPPPDVTPGATPERQLADQQQERSKPLRAHGSGHCPMNLARDRGALTIRPNGFAGRGEVLWKVFTRGRSLAKQSSDLVLARRRERLTSIAPWQAVDVYWMAPPACR